MSYSHRRGRRQDDDRDTKLSKALSWILRHGAKQVGLLFHSGGYLNVDDILNLQQFEGYTVEDVRRVVQKNSKQRFKLRSEENKEQICANQGHSLTVIDLELCPITDASKYPVVLHGTNFEAWKQIREHGLSRMKRIHIHLATGEPGTVVSGIRTSAGVLIYIDTQKALQDGIKFYESANGVVLSEGDTTGHLEVKYFKRVVDRKTGDVLL